MTEVPSPASCWVATVAVPLALLVLVCLLINLQRDRLVSAVHKARYAPRRATAVQHCRAFRQMIAGTATLKQPAIWPSARSFEGCGGRNTC